MRDWEKGIVKKIVTEEQLRERIKELGAQITKDYENDDADFIVVGILKGSILFMADLIREIKRPLKIDFMEISSYGDEFEEVILCTLLDKKVERKVDIDVQYVGFEIPNEFVLGYGLDFKQEYRNIPYIGVMDLDLYEKE